MKKAIGYIAIINFVFILLLSISGALGGALGYAAYCVSFVIPIAATLLVRKHTGMAFMPPRVKISREDLWVTVSLTAPSLALIFLASYLTSLVLSRFGEQAFTDVSGNLFTVILMHAVLTPIFEELLFRYVPIALLSPYSKRGAVLYSALFFAFVHANLYQLPYAFLAGLIFAGLDIATGSILPSVVMHILNNVISVLWLRYADVPSLRTVYVLILFVFALASVPFIILNRESLKKKIKPFLSGDGSIPLSPEAILFFALTLIIALINL